MGLVRWAKKTYLRRKLRKEVMRQWKGLTEDQKMKVFESKEQVANVLAMVASVLALVNVESIVAWLGQAGEAASSGQLEVVLAAGVSGLLGLSRFFSRLNRKTESKEMAREAVAEAAA